MDKKSFITLGPEEVWFGQRSSNVVEQLTTNPEVGGSNPVNKLVLRA
jgi:hypothetical protein